MTIPQIEELALMHDHICSALGDVKRLQILYALAQGPLNVSALAEALNSPQPTISRHLAVLRDRSLVTCERAGTSIIYRLADPRVITVLDFMRQITREALAGKASKVEEIYG